ncbi:transporter substrate-binding domain-containing protein [Desulfamplus magnetovallimortis]|uniref:transporter substrate-binding domain-containing protein n=1 Tax=Desulfamplus magnetovallimortis TaxID=1246637 RepID=UPI001C96E07A|nr:transporter substrate-binding domain-containing protein [Desulfamplus magnetovallimortis]
MSLKTSLAHDSISAVAAESEMPADHISNILTDHEKKWLQAHPVIRLAPDPEFKPIEFFDENGNYSGIAADYARLLEKKLGIRFKVILCASWDEVLTKMKNREVDLLPNAVKTPQREKYMIFPKPYLKIPSVIISKNNVTSNLDLDMLKGMKVTMVSGYGYADIIHNRYPEINIEFVADLKTALRKVSFGMSDAFIGDLATASYYIESEGITNLRLSGETDPPNISGFAVRNDWPELADILDKGIDLLTEEDHKTIQNRWIRLASEPGMTIQAFKKLMGIISVVISFVIIMFIIWNRMLKKRVFLKTEDLRKEIEEHKRTEDALAKSEAHLKTLLKTIPDLIWFKDPDGIYLSCNYKFERFFGAKEEKIVGKTDYDYLSNNMANFFRKHDRIAMDAGKPSINEETITYADDGHIEHLETIKTPVYGNDGKLIGVLGIARDITDRKKSEEEMQNLHAQLFQAQKMDAVGRLAGGVAHDFNNMLSIIIGRAELARMKLNHSDPIYKDLIEIESVGKRSADLTRQLLAFARKQTIVPEVLKLNATIKSMLKMLRRLIGEDIDLVWKPGFDIWSVNMDPAQIDQIMANLLINARDAIKGNDGKVIIETSNIFLDEAYCKKNTGFKTGEYVVLAVSDNGVGMEKETLKNIFEPFFTTKELGKGTGLGLSTIYGIVKQNNGFVNVYSEPDKGTTFRIYLPRYAGNDAESLPGNAEVNLTGGTETILLVEDDQGILEVAKLMLNKLGYNVLPANRPREAIEIAANHAGNIDLLVTDVIMPDMNGSVLAGTLLSNYPDMKLLYMSGYTANIIAQHGVIDSHVNFIQKPFSINDLAAKIREALKMNY